MLSVLVLVLFISHYGDTQSSDWLPSWTWECQDGGCVRVEKASSLTGMAQEKCWLVCGDAGSLWPKPGSVLLGNDTINFMPSDVTYPETITPTPEVRELLDQAIALFQSSLETMLPVESNSVGRRVLPQLEVRVTITSPDTNLTWTTDESYNLTLGSSGGDVFAFVVAPTFFGARHALQTLTQLIAPDADAGLLQIISSAIIEDAPVYPHRGLLVDTSRNFFSINDLKRIVNIMSQNKLNIFHWHLTDSHSWPLETPRVPMMSKLGAYSPEKVYSVQDVKDFLEYSRVRGVRVLPELDAPAHAGNGWQWGEQYGLGQLSVCINQQPWAQLCVEPPCGQLNPTNVNTYLVLQELFSDFLDIFDTDKFHMGGDEVFIQCWNSTQQIVDWLAANGRPNRTDSDFLDLWGYFQRRALESLDAASVGQKLPAILWTSKLTDLDVIENYLDRERYVIQLWIEDNKNLSAEIIKKGYKVIFSTKNAWYLDHGFGNWKGSYTTGYSYHPWQDVYSSSPRKILKNFGVDTATAAQFTLGGEAALWAEQADPSNMENRLWPRAAATAERLWGEPETSWQSARIRMMRHRHRLVEQGVNADGLEPQWCTDNEKQCI